MLLRAACPADLEVLLAPTDDQPTSTRSLQPDLLVVRRDDPGDKAVTTPLALALAVEVRSASSRSDGVLVEQPVHLGASRLLPGPFAIRFSVDDLIR